jgi:hypothetical protein
MASVIWTTTVDCGNPYALSLWWSHVLDFADDPADPNLPEHEECQIRSADGSTKILFIHVPEPKSVKNRVHFDLRPTDRTRDEEVTRLLDHGATVVSDMRQPDGKGWVVLADPEGNEFCVLRSATEVAAHSSPPVEADAA